MGEQLEKQTTNRRTILILFTVVFVMFGFGFAMVPLYSLFCQVAGVQSIAQDNLKEKVSVTSIEQTKAIDDREITVKFDATISNGLPWSFKPVLKKLTVRPGELNEIQFLARNLTDEAITSQAIPSIIPWQAGDFFNKIECFCFRQQTLSAGEERKMTLRFIISTQLPDEIGNITLSYTLMNVDPDSGKKYSTKKLQQDAVENMQTRLFKLVMKEWS